MFVRLLLVAPLLVAVLCKPSAALAWGFGGHEIVCELAYRQLSEEGRRLVREIRSEGGLQEPPRFSQTCGWPDTVRDGPFSGTSNYHFLNVEEGASGPDLARDCAALDCVVAAVQRYATVVAREPGSSRRDRRARAEALRFLGHFVADLHQPLHLGERADLGGNTIEVSWFGDRGDPGRPMQLHRVWDSEIIESADLESRAAVARLLARIREEEIDHGGRFALTAWAAESHRLAETFAYRYADDSRVRPGDDLGEGYFLRARPVVEIQLAQASVRLARLINAAADGTLPRNMVALYSPRTESP
jgi:hypothetical protein